MNDVSNKKNRHLMLGNTAIPHGIMLAPLAGVSDYAFRRICREHGAVYTVSEMVSAKALCYEQLGRRRNAVESPKTAPLTTVREDDYPMAVQLFGSEPEFMSEATARLCQLDYIGCQSVRPPAAIDINMGCPVHKVTANGEGSALLKDPLLCGRIVSAVAAASSVPVTVKIRIGWDTSSINAVEVARICQESGASLVCVHGRTRSQMYNPGVNRDVIAEVRSALSIPVIANGDIYNGDDARAMLEYTGCDGIMVARGALGNPWIFDEIVSTLEERVYIPPTTRERIAVALQHTELLIGLYGEKNGTAQARKHIAWYIKGIHGASAVRNKVMTCLTYNEIRELLLSLV